MSVSPTLSQYLDSQCPLPLVKRLPWSFVSPLEAYERLASPPYSFLLESVKGTSSIGRYSFVGTEPFLVLKSKGTRVELQQGGKKQVLEGENPIRIFKDLMKRFAVPRPKGIPPFFGGAVGFLSYDLVHFFEELPSAAVDDLKCPDLCMLFVDTLAVFDHAEQMVWLIHCPRGDRFYHEDRRALYEAGLERIAAMEQRLARPILRRPPMARRSRKNAPCSNFTKDQFMKIVRTCKEYIAAGDIYQANLSQRLMLEADPDPWLLYQALRRINPSPFSGCLAFDDLCLVSASPERLVRLQEGVVETRPIAGTRPRGGTTRMDEEMREILLANEKERAEHIMLVDLERNDLGRVCKYGSVKVNELMITEQYSHVIHIVSNIQGILADEKNCFDVIRAVFPGGTITGVPKVRCMEIISELEPVCRGPYSGSIGYISYSGEMDLNIVIRTFVIQKERVFIQVGAGIVADSDPEREYQETLYKAEALLAAVQAVA
jgi:anthranilate/para-aminobenzoate synthase component I